MSSTQIDLGAVKGALSKFKTANQGCVGVMKNINSKYIDGTQAEWNTPAAAKYIDALTSTFNDYIRQFNQKFQEGVNDFVEGVNTLAREQHANEVPKQSLPQISPLSRSWAEQSEKFNVPKDYASFTSQNLTAGIEQLKSHINEMQSAINEAVSIGLGSEFCNKLKDGLNKLKSSAESVATEYNGDAAKKAVSEDQTISTIKSST